QRVDPRIAQLPVELLGLIAHSGRLAVMTRTDHHLEWGDGVGPYDSALIVILLDRRPQQPGDADPIAAHLDRMRLSELIQESRPELLRVQRPQIEDVARSAERRG